MLRIVALPTAVLALGIYTARADDGLGLKRGGNPSEVSISGVSSGAAMAVQYAVAHSGSITAVGTIAGPAWGCADGRFSRAVNHCMCGRDALEIKIKTAHHLAAEGKIDGLTSGKPRSLKRSYVFHSRVDDTVGEESAKASIAFLKGFIGADPKIDWGNPVDGSDKAGHGIIAPDPGNERCQPSGDEITYIRRCGAEDNAGKLFHALFDPATPFDASRRVSNILHSEVWAFDQQRLIESVKVSGETVAPDYFWWGWASASPRRKNFDLAANGYIYVPPSCRGTGTSCRVHIALHGCKQNPRTFATSSGYNNWAEHYQVIVVYPGLEPTTGSSEAVCRVAPVARWLDWSLIEPNPNACWDWWGYLDTFSQTNRYLTKKSPQAQVIERIIAEVTRASQE